MVARSKDAPAIWKISRQNVWFSTPFNEIPHIQWPIDPMGPIDYGPYENFMSFFGPENNPYRCLWALSHL